MGSTPFDWSNPLNIIQLLGGAGNLATSTVGLLNQLGQQNFINGGKVNVMNTLNSMMGNAQNNINDNQGTLVNRANAGADQGLQNYLSSATGANHYINQGLWSLPGFTQMMDPNSIPGLSGVFGETGGLTGAGNTGLQSAQNFGQGTAQSMAPLYSQGAGLLNSAGSNPYNNFLQALGMGTASTGGFNPQLQQVFGEGTNLAQPGAAGAQGAMGLANSIFSGGKPVMPLDQALSLSENQNATLANNTYSQLKRQLQNTTGVGGPVVASGQNNELLQNLGTQALQSQAQGLTNTMFGQQAAGLQQLGSGTNLFNAGTGANLGYSGQGINAQLQSSGQAAQLMQALAQLGLGGGAQSLAQAQTGGNLLNSFNQTALGGLGATNSLLGTTGNLQNQIANMLFGSQQLGQTQQVNQQNSLNQLLSQISTQGSQGLQGFLGGSQIPANLLGQYISQQTSGGTAQPSLFSQNVQIPASFFQMFGGGGSGSNSFLNSLLGGGGSGGLGGGTGNSGGSSTGGPGFNGIPVYAGIGLGPGTNIGGWPTGFPTGDTGGWPNGGGGEDINVDFGGGWEG